MEVTFKYSIGDKVQLDRIEGLRSFGVGAPINWQMEKRYDEYVPRQYEVKGLGCHVKEDGSCENYYLFDTNDMWINYTGEYPEDYLSGIGETHMYTVEIGNQDICGSEINVGDVVYDHLYGNPYNTEDKGCHIGVLTAEVLVTGFDYMETRVLYPRTEILGLHKFPITDINGNSYRHGDARTLDHWKKCYPCGVIKQENVTDPKKIVEDLLNNPQFNYKKMDKYDKFYVSQWVERLGIPEEMFIKLKKGSGSVATKKKSAPRVTKTSPRETKDNKVENILNSLTPAEKEAMLKLLQK